MSQAQIEDNELSNADLNQLYQEALIEEHRRKCADFSDKADARGIVQDEDNGLYTDEHGNALNEYGERV